MKAAAGAKNGLLFQQKSGSYHVLVLKKGRQILLYFAEADEATGAMIFTGIMSRVDVYRPLALLGLYTQVMMLALLWTPDPTRVYIAGFGGGRMPMVLHHHFPRAVIDSTEIDPVVVSVSEAWFGIRQDERMRIHVHDARDFLAGSDAAARYDIIMVDCYTGAGAVPDKLASADFYALCKSRLAEGGVVVTNIDLSDRFLQEKLATFTQAFPHTMRFRDGVANVLFGSAAPLTHEQLLRRAAELAPQLSVSFPIEKLAERLRPAAETP